MNELKREISATQERTSQQLTKEMVLSTYQFRHKGNKHQFNFNCSVEDAIVSARSELVKVKPTDPASVEAERKADMSLDEGSKALATRQKHVKIADRPDLSWATYCQPLYGRPAYRRSRG